MGSVRSKRPQIVTNITADNVTATAATIATATVTQLVTDIIKQVTVNVTAAEIATLRATPKSIVPAPGAGKVAEFLSAVLHIDYTAPAFTESADNLGFKYENGSGTQVSEDIEMSGFIDATADKMVTAIAKKDVVMAANKAIVLHNLGDGEFGGSGGSDITVICTYRVHTVPT